MNPDSAVNIATLLNSTGVSLGSGAFSWPNIIAGLLFGTIGFVAFNYGRKEKSAKPFGIGLVLMVYSYFIPDTLWMYIIGITLTGLLIFWRD